MNDGGYGAYEAQRGWWKKNRPLIRQKRPPMSYSTREIATALGVGIGTVSEWKRAGKLPKVPFTAHADMMAFLATRPQYLIRAANFGAKGG